MTYERRMRLAGTVPQCRHGIPRVLCSLCASKRNQAEYEALAKITGRTVEELDADLTARDPRSED